ncbi:MAG: DUF1080 domain-containing protein [Verrucomicrobiales bacterium]
MKPTFYLLTLALVLINTIYAGHPEKNADGFVSLAADGELTGLETEGNWQAKENGVVDLEPREGEEGWKRYHHYLWTTEKYGDFIFDFEYKHGEGGNSGFHFRIDDREDPVAGGFEVQILDSMGLDDEKMGHHDLGGVIKTRGATKNMSKPAGEWNRMTVKMEGSHLTVVINGETVQDFDLAEEKEEGKKLADEGWIAIQDHGESFQVRNLQVKRL